MAKDDGLAERIRALVKGRPGVGEKHMFGGVCFTLNGAMACGTAKGKLMLRVGKDRHDEISAREHVTPMDFTGRPLRGFVYVEPEGYRTAAALRAWVDLALEVARAAPAKKSKRAARAKPLPPKLRALADRAKQKRAPITTATGAAQSSGFPPATLSFLRGLRAHNDKAWFDAHRADYEQHYLAPATAFVSALGPKLREHSPGVHFEPRVNGSLLRIHRDTRFSKDKAPYKPHMDLWFWHGDEKGWGAPGFFFRLQPDQLILGAGIHRLDKPQLVRFRAAVLDPRAGRRLAELIAALRKRRYAIGAERRNTVPRGLPADHERAELLLHEGMTAMFDGPPPRELSSPRFVDFCAEHYRALAPLNAWLLEMLG